MSLTLNFLGGAPFQLLYDGVKAAISATRRFRTQLMNLEFTLDCLQPQIIQQIRDNNVQLSLPDDIIQDLQEKMREGVVLVARLSQLSMWNIRIWGNCCDCIKPNYAEQLEDLDRSLRRLLELLKLEQIRNITLLMLRIDEIERRQSDILQALQDIPGHVSRAQQEVIQRMQANVAQQGRNGEGGAAAPAPVLGVVYGMLYDAVIQVKVKNLMFNRLLGEFKHSLDCLKPLIEDVANNNKVLHLPMLELEDFVIEMEKAVEFVHKCSKVSKLANYRKYPWTNKLLKLDKYLQKLFIDFKGQMEGRVKEAMELVSNIETVMNQTKDSGVVESDDIESEGRSPLPQPHTPSVGLELQTVLETSTHVIKKTLIDTATITEEVVKPSEESNIEPAPSHVVESDVLNAQGARDVVKETLNSARNLEVGDIGTEGTKAAVSTRNVQETSEVKEMLDHAKDMDETEVIRIEESDVWKLRNQTEIAVADQHESSEPTVQLKVQDVYETLLKETGDVQKTTQNPPPPRPTTPKKELQLQGPRPAPLKLSKDSVKIKKPPPHPHLLRHNHPPQQQQHFQPVVIYTVSPKPIYASVDKFMSLVQRLTGPSSSPPGDLSPAARLASIEKTSPSSGHKHSPPVNTTAAAAAAIDDDFMDTILEGIDIMDQFPGNLSPAPAIMPPIPAGCFSPAAEDLQNFNNWQGGVASSSNINSGSMASLSTLSSAPLVSPSPSSWDFFNNFLDS